MYFKSNEIQISEHLQYLVYYIRNLAHRKHMKHWISLHNAIKYNTNLHNFFYMNKHVTILITAELIQCFIFFSLGSPALVFSMFWIFCHCLSNSAFSSLGPARRVFRPSAILTPYWKAALKSRNTKLKHFKRCHTREGTHMTFLPHKCF